MAKHNANNIITSKDNLVCFASSTMLTPEDIHGGDDRSLPMSKVSGFASDLAKQEPRLPTLFASRLLRAREMYVQTKVMPFIYVQLGDGRLVSPFLVRRHHYDEVSDFLVAQSAVALFGFIIKHALANNIISTAIERPHDANRYYDIAVSMLPDNVTIHQEAKK